MEVCGTCLEYFKEYSCHGNGVMIYNTSARPNENHRIPPKEKGAAWFYWSRSKTSKMPIEVASSCEIISRNCSQFLSFLSLCVGRRWWNFENAHKITNKYEQQTIIHHTYPCTHGCNMLDVATTSARMLGSSENIRDRIQATYNNLYMLSHWRHLKIFEVLLCLSLSRRGAWNPWNTRERLLSRKRVRVHYVSIFVQISLFLHVV